jgi:hypothetical protein
MDFLGESALCSTIGFRTPGERGGPQGGWTTVFAPTESLSIHTPPNGKGLPSIADSLYYLSFSVGEC